MTTTQTEAKGKRSTGRKDSDKQPAVERPEGLVKKLDELITLYRRQATASEEFGDAVRATAEESGMLAKNVRSFVLARAGERFHEKKREVAQLAFIFEEIGE